MDKNFRIRLGVGFLFVALLGMGVMVRAAYIMLVPSKRLAVALERQFHQEPPQIPRRGYILDRNREPIAVSLEVKSLYVNPEKVDKKAQVAAWIAKALDLPLAHVRAKLQGERGFAWVKRRLSEKDESAMQALFDKHPGLAVAFGLAKESKRFYPNQNLAAHILGFTGLDSNGLEGVERRYDKELSGVATKPRAADGSTLILTIDKDLQHALEAELEAGVRAAGAHSGNAILMNAETGEITAMGSYPSYNPNKVEGGIEFRRNRSVTDTYEPGSTMKPILVAGALEAKAITAKTKVFCEYGKMQIGKHFVNEAESKDKWGWLKVGEVLQHSSNIGATKVGFLFGPEGMYNWYKKMGLTQKTGIDLPGEVTGLLSDPKSWSKIAQSNISFGQGVSVTPIQMIRAYAALANGGYFVRPHLLKQFLNGDEEQMKEIAADKKERVISEASVADVREMLLKVATTEGTGPKAAIPGFTVIGKTGTAQKAFGGHGYRSGKYVASFIGFVKGVHPNYVLFVSVDEPKFPYFGGEVAAPIFRKVMAAALAKEGVAPLEAITPTLPLAKRETKFPSAVKVVAPTSLQETKDGLIMPNLMGQSAREVLDAFDKKDVQLKLHGGGLVVEQIPAAGKPFHRGETVSIRLDRDSVLP